MKWNCETQENLKIFRMNGDFKFPAVADVTVLIREAVESTELHTVLLNFKEVDLMDSSGIGFVVNCARSAKKKKSQFFISNLNAENLEVLDVTNLSKYLDIFDSEEEALTALNS